VTGHILLALAAIALYAALRLVFPTARCPRCLGRRVLRSPGRARRCWACNGRGRVVWPGATAVHRFWWSAVGDRMRERRRAGHQARQHTSYHPGPQPPDRRNHP
jgi:hypothetical protein